MKLQVTILILLFISTSYCNGNDTIPDSTNIWSTSAIGALNMNQNQLSNWSAGGENSIAGTVTWEQVIHYRYNNFSYTGNAALAYGLMNQAESGIRKTDDKINLTSKANFLAFGRWHYTLLADFQSQFDKGYKYPDDSTVVSNFFAPAILTISLGMDYHINEYISMMISPASGKMIFVQNQALADKGSYGVKEAIKDSEGNILHHGEMFKGEIGLALSTTWQQEIKKNILLFSRLNIHNNYIDPEPSNRWNFDIDWETRFNFVITDYLTTSLKAHILYDHNIRMDKYKNIEGKKTVVGQSPVVQFKEALGIGLAVKI